MKYIIELPERKNCSRCPITHSEFDVCCVTATNIREYLYDDNATKPLDCPLKPLKVKQLEWFYEKSHVISCESIIGKFTIYTLFDQLLIELNSSEIHEIIGAYDYAFEQAKEFCQQHYEKMILSALEEK